MEMTRIMMVCAVVGSTVFIAATLSGAFKQPTYTLASDPQ
jgi:hypothetical protein